MTFKRILELSGIKESFQNYIENYKNTFEKLRRESDSLREKLYSASDDYEIQRLADALLSINSEMRASILLLKRQIKTDGKGKNVIFDELVENEEHQEALRKTGMWGKAGAGCLFFAKDTKKFCINHRSPYVLQPGEYGCWGGAIDSGENPQEAVKREIKEEAGYDGVVKLIPIFVFKKDAFKYYNYIAVVEKEFTPTLDWESSGYVWCDFGDWPSPLHFGIKAILNDPKSVEVMKKLSA